LPSLSERSAAADPVRGDANGDSAVNIADASFILGFLFLGTRAPACEPIADGNGDTAVNIADASFILGFLFIGGAEPPPLSAAEIAECGGGPDPAAIERGRAVYDEVDGTKKFACSTCHAASPESGDFLYAASSLHDALARPSYKLGKLTSFLDAANTCREHWMVTSKWTEDDTKFKDLTAFLRSITPPGPAPAVVYTIALPNRRGPATGDADRGCALFHRSCVNCHGLNAQGTERGTSLAVLPLAPDFIRAKVRISGPVGTVYEGLGGGNMPFWSIERLDDEQLEDLTTYLMERPIRQCAPDAD
jgi:mono/diheme cytochrome c family protein